MIQLNDICMPSKLSYMVAMLLKQLRCNADLTIRDDTVEWNIMLVVIALEILLMNSCT